ncbi:MAG: hypothetical protein H2B02_04975, partial [Nitrosopumilaceae archaeon]|nr:hypothetical protein [Nitrosopumilaceae archaeon]
VDDSNKSLIISLDKAPSPMQGLEFQYKISPSDNKSDLEISTEIADSPEMEQMMRGYYQ